MKLRRPLVVILVIAGFLLAPYSFLFIYPEVSLFILTNGDEPRVYDAPKELNHTKVKKIANKSILNLVRNVTGNKTGKQELLALQNFLYKEMEKMPGCDIPESLPYYSCPTNQTELSQALKIKKGCCGLRSKTFALLATIAGYPARTVSLKKTQRGGILDGGHTVTEIYLNESWSMFDPYYNRHFELDNGQVSSVMYLARHPEIINDYFIKHVTNDSDLSSREKIEIRPPKLKYRLFPRSNYYKIFKVSELVSPENNRMEWDWCNKSTCTRFGCRQDLNYRKLWAKYDYQNFVLSWLYQHLVDN